MVLKTEATLLGLRKAYFWQLENSPSISLQRSVSRECVVSYWSTKWKRCLLPCWVWLFDRTKMSQAGCFCTYQKAMHCGLSRLFRGQSLWYPERASYTFSLSFRQARLLLEPKIICRARVGQQITLTWPDVNRPAGKSNRCVCFWPTVISIQGMHSGTTWANESTTLAQLFLRTCGLNWFWRLN